MKFVKARLNRLEKMLTINKDKLRMKIDFTNRNIKKLKNITWQTKQDG